jgi:hypothetical protein
MDEQEMKEERDAWLLAWGRSIRCSDQRVDTMMARNEKPALGTWAHHAFMLDLRRGLHARTYSRVRALARPGQAFGYLTHFGSMWIPSSLFIMFCRGVRSMEPFVSVVSVRRRLLFRWRMSRALARRSKRALRMRHAWNRRAAPRDPMEFLVPSWLLNLFVRSTFRRLSAHLFGPPNPKKTGFSFRVCYPTACLGFDGSRIGCPLSLSLARPLSTWTMISSESSHHWIHARAVMIRLRCSASVNRAGDHCSSLLQHWPLAISRHFTLRSYIQCGLI